jgi:hypothetical protein
MTTLTEAARAALEALTNCSSEHGHRCNRCDSEVDEGGKVADALRAALAASEVQAGPVGHVRIDSGEVHIVPKERDAEFSALRDGQSVYAHPPAPEQPAPALASAPRVPQEQQIRALLWDEHPECCGSPVVGAEYMGQQEMLCCGCPEPALLNDAQIVASLRAMFPEAPAPQPEGDTP